MAYTDQGGTCLALWFDLVPRAFRRPCWVTNPRLRFQKTCAWPERKKKISGIAKLNTYCTAWPAEAGQRRHGWIIPKDVIKVMTSRRAGTSFYNAICFLTLLCCKKWLVDTLRNWKRPFTVMLICRRALRSLCTTHRSLNGFNQVPVTSFDGEWTMLEYPTLDDWYPVKLRHIYSVYFTTWTVAFIS